MIPENRTIYAFQALPYNPVPIYWYRDMGLLVRSWKRMGFNAKLVLFYNGHPPASDDLPLILISEKDAHDAEWWKAQKPWAVVFNTWGATRFAGIWQAARVATGRIAERLDTDGLRSPRVDLFAYVYSMWARMHESSIPKWKTGMSWLTSPAQALIHLSLPSLLENRMAYLMSQFPLLYAETPVAVSRIRRFVQSFDYSTDNLRLLPHPVDLGDLPLISDIAKTNTIASIGRWDIHIKNFPLVLSVFDEFLARNSTWSGILIGQRPDNFKTQVGKYAPQAGNRIQLTNRLPHPDSNALIAQSKIFVMTSRMESFGIAAAEALCCGCSVVGPPHIPSIPWFCSMNSGTVSPYYNRNGLLDALASEVIAWNNGNRTPETIGNVWRSIVGSDFVASAIINDLYSLNPDF